MVNDFFLFIYVKLWLSLYLVVLLEGEWDVILYVMEYLFLLLLGIVGDIVGVWCEWDYFYVVL